MSIIPLLFLLCCLLILVIVEAVAKGEILRMNGLIARQYDLPSEWNEEVKQVLLCLGINFPNGIFKK